MRCSALVVGILALAACASAQDEAPLYLYLLPPGAAGDPPERAVVARIEVASTPEERSRGLMHRDGLAPDSGMLFIYPSPGPRRFWMMNTRIPLSIAYADQAGRIFRILDMEPAHGKPPSSLRFYPSGEPALYALEMERGWFAAKGVTEGVHLRFHPAIHARPVR